MSKRKSKKTVAAARAAGEQYVQDQIQSDYFQDWVWGQMVEAEEMRKRDPNSVMPLESKADYDRLGRNMLQQLGWDIDRDLDPSDVIGDASREEQQEFWDGLHEELRNPNVRNWLVEEIIIPFHEELKEKAVNEARQRRPPPRRPAQPAGRLAPMTPVTQARRRPMAREGMRTSRLDGRLRARRR